MFFLKFIFPFSLFRHFVHTCTLPLKTCPRLLFLAVPVSLQHSSIVALSVPAVHAKSPSAFSASPLPLGKIQKLKPGTSNPSHLSPQCFWNKTSLTGLCNLLLLHTLFLLPTPHLSLLSESFESYLKGHQIWGGFARTLEGSCFFSSRFPDTAHSFTAVHSGVSRFSSLSPNGDVSLPECRST